MKKYVVLLSTSLAILLTATTTTSNVNALDEFSDKTTVQDTPSSVTSDSTNYTVENIPSSSVETNSNSTYDSDEPLIQKRPENEEADLIGELKDAYQPITKEGLQEAKAAMGPIYKPLSVFISMIVWATFLLTGLVTAIDILYIKVPFLRKFLYTPGTDGTGGVSGVNATGGQSIGGIQWISDEAASVVSLLGGSAQANGHGMGVYGAGGVGSGAQPSGVQQSGGKSVLFIYLTRRIGTLILLGATMPLIFTSFFINAGFNVGSLILDIAYSIMNFFS